MPHYTEYRCSECKKLTQRGLLVVKAVVFKTMGSGPRIIRSRNKGWLCDECILVDPDYTSDAFTDAPGMKSPAKERVEAAIREELGR